jgi:WD40 repeat protein
LEQIGEGGMGVVFMAEQQQPVRRKVALKVLKPGMDTRLVVARFEAERQALALMDHPNIAHVFDGGETTTGRPYFVMELVRGTPITEFCDQSQLSVRQRLELFVSACQAVQHAHQKGIIHRDLKPSNVLVTVHDTTPVVKVIDFGIAKAMGQQLTEKTLFTHFAQMVGTPLYMSPEQAGQSSLDVDTRSDIYSLSVLLYELLTGTTPFDKERLRKAAYDEIRRIIREEEPPKPSTRISTLGQAATSLSTQRQSDPKRLRQLFRGELDWIVMKALEKDRTRRYETASAFAADVQRYLHDEPVAACPPSSWYRFRKFARRRKGALTVAASIALAGILALLGLAVSYVQIDEARHQAEQNAEQEGRARKETVVTLYYQTIALAEREYSTGNVGRAEQLLDRCPEELRGWEWNYLKRLRYGSRRALPHSSCMFDLALSPDGRLLAAGGHDGIVKLWDTRTWEEVRSFPAHRTHIARIRFGPDGRHLATAAFDGTVKIWNVATDAARPQILEYDNDDVGSLAFSSDGRWIAAAGGGHFKVWDTAAGRPVCTLPSPTNKHGSLAFSPDGRCLAVGSVVPGTVTLWETASWTELRTLRPHAAEVRSLAFRPDGAQLAVACGPSFWNGDAGEVAIWDTATWQKVYSLTDHVCGAFAVAFAPDGRRLASGGAEDALVKIWDVQTGRETLSLRGHSGGVWGLVFSPDGSWLYSAGTDHTVRAWDATQGGPGDGPELRMLRGHTRPVSSVDFSPDNRYLVSGSMDRTLKVWETLTGKEICTVTGHSGPIRGVAFIADGRQLASVSLPPDDALPDDPRNAAGEVKLWDTNTWRELPGVGLNGDNPYFLGLASHADGRRLAATATNCVVVWDTATRSHLRTFLAPSSFILTCTAFGPSGRLAAADINGTVYIWDLSAAAEAGSYAAVLLPPAIDRLPDVWRATTSLPARVLRAHEGLALRVAFSPDGAYLASAGIDGTIRFWDARTYEPIETLRGHLGTVHGLAFRPDGKRLASAGSDAVIRVWDTATRRQVLALHGHTDVITTVAISSDGRFLASGGWDGTVKIWELP